jgi:hypothetical protein
LRCGDRVIRTSGVVVVAVAVAVAVVVAGIIQVQL